ncbi:MAG: 50S ribosomal protein L21 [Fimbriimonadaceae bacterium]
MYAIVQTGGKQYQAQSGEVLIVEKIDGEVGTKLELADVLAVIDGDKTKLGSPYVKGARVRVEIIRQAKAKKINAFNYKAKKNERRRWGHRQPQTHLRVTEVVAGS